MSIHLIFIVLFLTSALRGSSQSPAIVSGLSTPNETGFFYSRHYPPKEYNGAFQNWGGVQNEQGIMFFCNTDGVLVYDGKIWSLVQTPSQSVIRSLGIDASGKVFVGSLDDFGYLDRSKNGSYCYISLVDKIDEEIRAMGNVWQTLVDKSNVYFESETGLYSWNGERVEFWPWPDPNAYHICFLWNGKMYMQEEGRGLMILKNNEFISVPGGSYFKTKRIYNTLPLKNNTIQLATQYDGLFQYDGRQTKPFPTKADNFFRENQIYCGAILADSLFVYGTRLGGAVIINNDGTVRYLINDKTGLPTNIALGLTVDLEGNLWFSLDNGISKFEINNGLSAFDIRSGLQGAINSFCRYNGKLYVATNSGLYFLNPGSFPEFPPSFKKVSAISRSCFRLLNIGDRMLVSSSDGLFELLGEEVHLLNGRTAHAIHRYRNDSTRIVVGFGDQLKSLKLVNGQWREAGDINNIKLDVVDFHENFGGRVWLTSYSQGTALLSFPEKDNSINYDEPAIKFFGKDDGIPEGLITNNFISGREIFQIGSNQRIFRFDYEAERFEEEPNFFESFDLQEKNLFIISDDDKSGKFYLRTMPDDQVRQEVILLERGDNSFQNKRLDISRISEHVHIHFYEEGNILWFGGADGIVRYDIRKGIQTDKASNTYINKIVLLGDSVFFQGAGNAQQNLTFPYLSNSFRFEFTSANFAAEERNQFQYKLEGYDEEWSEWTTENIKEYPRLWEGTYTFFVRSRDHAENVGNTDQFTFRVAPPWYRSFYAYTVYFIAVAVLVWAFIRWRLQSILREKEALKAEIAHQTQEIRHQNKRLEEQSEELKLNAEQLKELDKMKSNFFVNISHEFRTPLSLILTPLEKVIHEKEQGGIRPTEIERMHRNAKRLQQLINQLLDLAKLESGGMKLNNKQSDFLYFMRVLVSSFESMAESRNIQFEVVIPTGSFVTDFDIDKLETVLYNLLSNAFKFTPDGGQIFLAVLLPNENDPLVSVSVADTGPGIPKAEVDRIFDRFYQIDSSNSREFEGSGIGLSLVRELVLLMNGRIDVESNSGTGATFKVKLPLPRLSQMAEPSEVGLDSGNYLMLNNIKIDDAIALNESRPANGAMVLVVEDNADLRAYLTESLEDEYRVVLAENGLEGYEKAIELTPDLIISDMMMPVMDGFVLCSKIRADERTSHIPFVLLTARSTIESKLEGLELGADEYIIKPFNIKELEVRVKNLMEQRRQLRKSFSREVMVQPKNISITSVDERFLNHALEIMESHLSDEQFSVERFADEMGMSRKNLLRKIKALTDQSVNEFIRNFRLQRAAQLLSANSASISEIAYKVGFNNLSYFSKCFKELFGVVPNEYKA